MSASEARSEANARTSTGTSTGTSEDTMTVPIQRRPIQRRPVPHGPAPGEQVPGKVLSLVGDGSGTAAAEAAPARSGPRWAGLVLFVTAAATYLGGGVWLCLGHDSVTSDALSRTANGYYTVFSRDPHLAAVGFVWNPLPSLAQIPLLPLATVWPEFAYRGVAAAVQSALFMAGAVVYFRRTCLELGAGPRVAWALTVLFAVHPEIAYYGMNGMSEGSFLFFLLAATAALTRWVRTRASNPLAGAGLALGAAYLTRYETVAAGLVTTVFVGLVAYRRTRGPATLRRSAALGDMTVLALPFVFSFAVWAITSSLIIDSPFAQFTSANGNTAQTRLSAGGISSVIDQPGGPLGYMFDQSRVLEPFGALILAAALGMCWRRRDARLLAPIAVLGGAYSFSVAALLAGQTFGWLRFSITIVPVVLLAAATLLAHGPYPVPTTMPPAVRAARRAAARTVAAAARRRRSGGRSRSANRLATAGHRLTRRYGPGRYQHLALRHGHLVLPGVVLVMLAAAGPVTADGMLNPRLAREESYFLTQIFDPGRASPEQRRVVHRYVQDRTLARWLDRQRLPHGAVLLDAADGYEVVLSSRRPDQFAITPDRDFATLLGDPKGHRVRYLVTRLVSGSSPADAVADAHPRLQTDPAYRLARVEPNPGDLPAWHVYAVR
ncbi:hypothetical protein [Frankia sp. AgB32]|uniref:hypothetical protein n=1 Tax=Frankia sp. AgB32 TaxID=631119 RepID=UPI00200DD4F6|nr:hypothetical protein [Frankia sp. AgB32]MCK9893718.1 hypothetical protein [Frankia sp. AgB32]